MLTRNAWVDGIKLYRKNLMGDNLATRMVNLLGEQVQSDLERTKLVWRLNKISGAVILPKKIYHPGVKYRDFMDRP